MLLIRKFPDPQLNLTLELFLRFLRDVLGERRGIIESKKCLLSEIGMVVDKLVRVSSKGQIVLPKRMRDEVGIREGDYVSVWRTRDGFLVIQKREDNPLWALCEPLRREAAEQGFTRHELNELIHAIRSEKLDELESDDCGCISG